MFQRVCKVPSRQSFFLFGPRQTGKSTLVGSLLDPGESWTVDLLHSDTYFRYLKDPSQFRREAESQIAERRVKTIFVDEIQRIPELLNEIHSLLQSKRCRFVMSGSSARKLKRGGANLLAGRAAVRHLHPLTVTELGSQFDLRQAFRFGTLPPVINSETDGERRDILKAYANTYLKEEVQAEGLARNIGGFTRFLDVAAGQSGEITNFSSIGREVLLSARSVQSYFEILEETLIAFRLESYGKSARRRLLRHPKFYLFDLGVLNALNQRLAGELDGSQRGKLFEHFLVLETMRLISYSGSDANIYYWQTSHGAEVDLIIEKNRKILAAVEIKARKNVSSADLSGLRSFRNDHPEVRCLVASEVPQSFELELGTVLPWREYLDWIESQFF